MVGPAVPDYLAKSTSIAENVVGPMLSEESIKDTVAVNFIGPSLPKHDEGPMDSENKHDCSLSASISEEYTATSIIGPALPEHLSKIVLAAESETTSKEHSYGPQLPPHLQKKKETTDSSNDENVDVYGPLPMEIADRSSVQQILEERAQILKYEFLLKSCETSTEEPKRESWMTELPPEKAGFIGLEGRKFRTSYSGDKSNRSLWTETPSTSSRKRDQPIESDDFETANILRRNKMMDKIVKKSKKHKKEKKSLLDLHTEKLKKKQKGKNEDNKPERRPFDRDVDLQVNRFDEAQKRSIIHKAQLLNSRFSSGKSKYL